MKYVIGCSGFHYKHWRGDFYPKDLPVKKWFEYYCQHFNTLELNVSFYRFPTPEMLSGWYEKSPRDFLFSVKVPRSITHFKKLNNAERMIKDFYEVIQSGLKEKLGCVLFQFPPNFSCSDQHIDRIIENLDSGFKNVVEFRHKSWWDKAAIEHLGSNKIAFCGMSHPDFPEEVIDNAPHLYYRMHGGSQLYSSDYDHQTLDRFLAKLKGLDKVKQAYVYFNNDVKGYAPENARYLAGKAAS
jgi:uncharacterized protein YecE (DUF72 family)